jgi:hypothetical protein
MNARIKSPYTLMFVLAIAVVGMVAVAGSVGADKVEHRMDVWAMMTSVDMANLPVLEIVDPI